MKIGIYIGSFNPPHIGHKKVAEYLTENRIVDKVMIIPTGNYWDKNNLIPINYRIDMLKFYENDRLIVDSVHNDIEYTYLLLRELQKEYPSDTLYLIIGADNVVSLDKWMCVDEILNHQIIVVNRDNIDVRMYINKFANKNNFHIIDDFPKFDVSSTEIRRFIKERKNNNLNDYLDNNVYEYILKNNLYS